MADAVERGLAPLRQEMADMSRTVKTLLETFKNLRLSFEVLARRHEHVLKGVVFLRGDTAKGFHDIMASIAAGPGPSGDVTGGVWSTEDVVKVTMSETKRLLRIVLYERTAKAVRSANVCSDSQRNWAEILALASQVLRGTEDEADDWLQTFMKVPSRKEASAMKQTRRSKPVLRVKPHIMCVLK